MNNSVWLILGQLIACIILLIDTHKNTTNSIEFNGVIFLIPQLDLIRVVIHLLMLQSGS